MSGDLLYLSISKLHYFASKIINITAEINTGSVGSICYAFLLGQQIAAFELKCCDKGSIS